MASNLIDANVFLFLFLCKILRSQWRTLLVRDYLMIDYIIIGIIAFSIIVSLLRGFVRGDVPCKLGRCIYCR